MDEAMQRAGAGVGFGARGLSGGTVGESLGRPQVADVETTLMREVYVVGEELAALEGVVQTLLSRYAGESLPPVPVAAPPSPVGGMRGALFHTRHRILVMRAALAALVETL